jgi:hypothetical protein
VVRPNVRPRCGFFLSLLQTRHLWNFLTILTVPLISVTNHADSKTDPNQKYIFDGFLLISRFVDQIARCDSRIVSLLIRTLSWVRNSSETWIIHVNINMDSLCENYTHWSHTFLDWQDLWSYHLLSAMKSNLFELPFIDLHYDFLIKKLIIRELSLRW